ncbi:Uncharacterised protein [Mesomycoplasma dispar]|uniref:Uncharacterized protein n=1 Tax=Mesomycoplasma dispar TaxID=86660 RepID=A0AAJ5TCY9_9BACT|nr:hypothetical protein [Mesomycoplasma dispar]AJR12504.1 hypothetical protein MDIS_04110 [Mesomycoplasma dispar]VEU62791.1 Uncharacterised protein [Mesomycoplasma dispar]
MKNKITPCIWSLISNTHLRKAESVEILIRALFLNKEEINQNFKNKWLKIYKNKNWKPIGDLTEHLKLAAQLGVAKTDILTPGQQKINILAKLVNNGTIKIREYISIILFNLVSFINYEYRHIFKMTLELLKKKNNSPVTVDEIFENLNFGEPTCPEFNIKLLRYSLTQKDHIFYILISGVFFDVQSTREKNQQYSTDFFKIKLYEHWYSRVDELIQRCNNQFENYTFEKASLIRLDSEKWSNYLTQNSQDNYDYIVEISMQKEIDAENEQEKMTGSQNKTLNLFDKDEENSEISMEIIKKKDDYKIENIVEKQVENQTPYETVVDSETNFAEKEENITELQKGEFSEVYDSPELANVAATTEIPEVSFSPEQIENHSEIEKVSEPEKLEKEDKPIENSENFAIFDLFNQSLEESCCCETDFLTEKSEPKPSKKLNEDKADFHPEQFEKSSDEIFQNERENFKKDYKLQHNLDEKCCNSSSLDEEKLDLNCQSKIENYFNNGEKPEKEKHFLNEKFSILPSFSHSKRELENEVSKYPISNSLNSKEYYFNYFIHKINKLFNFSLQNLLNQTSFKQNFFNLLDFKKGNHDIVLKPKKTLIKTGENVLLISRSSSLIYSEIKNRICKSEIYEKNYEIVTFFDEYDEGNFVGFDDFSLEDKEQSSFLPGSFSTILKKSYWNPEKKYCLILENINNETAKSTLAPFRPLFVRGENGESLLGISNPEISSYIFSHSGMKIFIPGNLTIIGTIVSSLDDKTADFSNDTLENWEIEYLEDELSTAETTVDKICDTDLSWKDFLNTINLKAKSEKIDKSKLLSSEIDKKALKNPIIFANKVLFQLWNFTFKEKRSIIFNHNSYSSLIKKFKESKNSERLNIFKLDFFNKNLG